MQVERKMNDIEIALDAMGGDYAPVSTIEGALMALDQGVSTTLVGDEDVLREHLLKRNALNQFQIIHASDVVPMDEHAALSVRRNRNTSLWAGVEALKMGTVSGFISVGNTGAAMATALAGLGRLPGIERPALGGVLPTVDGKQVMFLDIGANADARPSQLVQFAHMGTAYMRSVFNIDQPKVALLSIGGEETKGSNLVIETHQLLKEATNLNFAGNIEGHEILSRGTSIGGVDVIVTDGFTGNMCLKLAEGVIGTLLTSVRNETDKSIRAKVGGLLLSPALKYTRDQLDYRRHGAVMMLGIRRPVFIGHGRSDATAIASALVTADNAVRQGLTEALQKQAESIT